MAQEHLCNESLVARSGDFRGTKRMLASDRQYRIAPFVGLATERPFSGIVSEIPEFLSE
jgi:hypothetical protein